MISWLADHLSLTLSPTVVPSSIPSFNPTLLPTYLVRTSKPTVSPTNPPTLEPTIGFDSLVDDPSVSYSSGRNSFSVQRIGYDVLPFFGQSSSTIINYAFLDGYDSLIEPYVPSRLVFLAPSISSDRFHFKYQILSENGQNLSAPLTLSSNSADTDSFSLDCEPHERFFIQVDQEEETGASNLNHTYFLRVICMSVRREMRELSESDLSASIQAMHALWALNESRGQELYGEDFHEADWFTSLHNFNAGWQDADHIHEGLGFLPQHSKMSNLFEKAMRAVDPSVSLFYWDCTIEEAKGRSVFESDLFKTSTFGTLLEPMNLNFGWTYENDSLLDASIQDGLWAHSRVSSTLSTPIHNAYGYLRGPWNMNPSPYISRFAGTFVSLPNCLSYYKWLENAPHGSSHALIGGMYGCDLLKEMQDKGYLGDDSDLLSICGKWGFYIKELYRGNFLLPYEDGLCEVVERDGRVVNSTCGFVCNEESLEDMIDYMQSGITLSSYLPSNLSDAGWESWKDFVCEGNGYRIFSGDHLESASPADPSFWPIHPTQDRLLQLKYMSGGFEEYSWPTTSGPGDPYVCNHQECYSTSSSPKAYSSSCCYGHFEFDRVYDFTTNNKSQFFGLTNGELLASMDPTSPFYSVDYIYSHFDWPHCSDLNFPSLAETLYLEK